MAAGRKPKPIPMKKLKGNPGKRMGTLAIVIAENARLVAENKLLQSEHDRLKAEIEELTKEQNV